jgi:hypothetical protein
LPDDLIEGGLHLAVDSMVTADGSDPLVGALVVPGGTACNEDSGAMMSEFLCGSAAYSPGSACDDGDFASEIHCRDFKPTAGRKGRAREGR